MRDVVFLQDQSFFAAAQKKYALFVEGWTVCTIKLSYLNIDMVNL